MELPRYIKDLWRHKVLVVFALVLAGIGGVIAGYQPSSSGFTPRYSTASSSTSVVLLLSSPRQPIIATEVQVPRGDQYFRQDLPTIAGIYSYMVSGVVRDEIQRQVGGFRSGVDALSAVRRSTQPGQSEMNSQLSGKQNLPLLQITGRSSTPSRASGLVDAAVASLQERITDAQDTAKTPALDRISLTQISSGTTVTSSSPATRVSATVGALSFIAFCALIALIPALSRQRRRLADSKRVNN